MTDTDGIVKLNRAALTLAAVWELVGRPVKYERTFTTRNGVRVTITASEPERNTKPLRYDEDEQRAD